jgi:hypothetical protein
MSEPVVATPDSDLHCRIVRSASLSFEGATAISHENVDDVRDTSRIVHLVNREALVADEANALILIDLEAQRVRSRSLAPSGEEAPKTALDLETCAPVPGSDGRQLLAFGSGSGESREWIVVVDWRTPTDPPRTILHEAPELFESLREIDGFAADPLNIEGAIFLDDDTLRVYHRGNPQGARDDEPVDATVDLQWEELEMYLRDTTRIPPPTPRNVIRYDFGRLDDVRLTFSDAVVIGEGDALLYTAAAEDTGGVTGSVLGLLDDDGARYTTIEDEDGAVFAEKVEGLRRHPTREGFIQFVIDTENVDTSRIFEAELSGPWGL